MRVIREDGERLGYLRVPWGKTKSPPGTIRVSDSWGTEFQVAKFSDPPDPPEHAIKVPNDMDVEKALRLFGQDFKSLQYNVVIVVGNTYQPGAAVRDKHMRLGYVIRGGKLITPLQQAVEFVSTWEECPVPNPHYLEVSVNGWRPDVDPWEQLDG